MTFAPRSDELLYREQDGIGWLTFNRPQVRNALTFAMYEGVAELCSLEADELPRVIVISGAGEAFAAGTDISQFVGFRTNNDAIDYESRMTNALDVLEDCPAATIAAIRGACTGGGAAIASACDLRIGARSALFGMPIARTIGNCLSIDNCARLSAVIGPSRLKEVIFSARLLGVEESQAIGWLHEVVDETLLEARAIELAETLKGHAPLTLRATKSAFARMRRAALPSDEDLLAMCYTSEDFREGVDAFLTKRPPTWTGR